MASSDAFSHSRDPVFFPIPDALSHGAFVDFLEIVSRAEDLALLKLAVTRHPDVARLFLGDLKIVHCLKPPDVKSIIQGHTFQEQTDSGHSALQKGSP